jgi:hypothetical protein
MLPGRCSLELSDRKLHRKIKSHKLRAKPTCPALPRLAVGLAVEGSAVPRTFLEMFFDRV